MNMKTTRTPRTTFPPRSFRLLTVLSLICASVSALANAPQLESGFRTPPPEAAPWAYWDWINGNVTKEGIRADFADMKRVGIGGVILLDLSIYLPPGPVRYGSDMWHDHLQFAVRTAEELGLKIFVMNCAGWSGSGGPWITPEQSMKRYVWTETEVAGGRADTVALPQSAAKLGFYKDIAVFAVPAHANAHKPVILKDALTYELNDGDATPSTQVFNLSKAMDTNGVVQFQLPEGKWTLLRFGYTSTGSTTHPAVDEGNGLECDKLDSNVVEFQFNQSMGRMIRDAGPLAGEAFSGVHFDSFEGGIQNWTRALPEKFQTMKGYDLFPFIPVLTGRAVVSREESEAFRRDFNQVVKELLAQQYFGTMQRLCHQQGLKVSAEAQGGPLDPVLCNEFTDFPMDEFWMPDASRRIGYLKQIASVSELLGRQIVGAEAFTAKPEDGRWLATPATMKMPGDAAFTAGINRFVLHAYVHQPYENIAPGFTHGRYGTHFGRFNTWWPFADAWIRYLSRCQFLLQQGRTVANICFLSDEQIGYTETAAGLEVPRGFDFGICYPRHLAKANVKEKAICFDNGPTYRALVLPEQWTSEISTLRVLQRIVDAGVVVVGPRPRSPGGLTELRSGSDEFRSLVKVLWNGRIKAREQLPLLLTQAGILPDCAIPEPKWRFAHRVLKEGDLFFISNQSTNGAHCPVTFHVANRVPELWDPVTGKISDAPTYEFKDGCVQVPLRLEASGSVFVLFRRASIEEKPKVSADSSHKVFEIAGPWTVLFQPGRGAPTETSFDKLISWTEHADPGIRYFSGFATYETTFTVTKDWAKGPCYLNLGKVCDLAELKLNSRTVGIAWTAPFRLDVTEYLQPGTNRLVISVANRWVNRLIGDAALPEDANYSDSGTKFTKGRLLELPAWIHDPEAIRKRQRFTFSTWHHYDKNSPLLESGLLGPVQLER